MVRWRADHSIGYEHLPPVTAEAIAVLQEARNRNFGPGTLRCFPRRRTPPGALAVRGFVTGGERPECSLGWSRSVAAAGTH